MLLSLTSNALAWALSAWLRARNVRAYAEERTARAREAAADKPAREHGSPERVCAVAGPSTAGLGSGRS